MEALRIVGGRRLEGSVQIEGSKNASLPIMAAALLANGKSTLRGVPPLADVQTLSRLLQHIGCEVTQLPGELSIDASRLGEPEAPYDLVRTMRASFLVLGPLLARTGRAKVSLPGGCAIGARPVDQHLMALRCMGAELELDSGYVLALAPQGLKGAEVFFDVPTVGGTENAMLAASLAQGVTVLHGAAWEPEVVDLGRALQGMGVPIEGLGTDTVTIEGVAAPKPYDHRVIADRIEFGTFAMAAALTGDRVRLLGADPAHQENLIEVLGRVGACVTLEATPATAGTKGETAVVVEGPSAFEPVDVVTAAYPGYPTDMQAQLMALLALAKGVSTVTESIFENRFMHVAELSRMGAQIRVRGNVAEVTGVNALSGSTVMATDLRASACLVLAGLVARGETTIRRLYHLDRGYYRLESKLGALGANVTRVPRA